MINRVILVGRLDAGSGASLHSERYRRGAIQCCGEPELLESARRT